jgi:hypothetical protein
MSTISRTNFGKGVEKSRVPVSLLGFHMIGCRYCEPLVGKGKVLSRIGGDVEVFEIERSDELTEEMSVRSFPTLLLVHPRLGVFEWTGDRDPVSLRRAAKLMQRAVDDWFIHGILTSTV